MMFSDSLISKTTSLLDLCCSKNIKIVTAESCTGGLIGCLITSIAGSSAAYECGFITYSNDAKIEQISVPASLISEYGAVSGEVAKAMAEGALKHSKAQLSIAITGIAGPQGGSIDKPVGLVYIASTFHSEQQTSTSVLQKHLFTGDRQKIRISGTIAAIELLLTQIRG